MEEEKIKDLMSSPETLQLGLALVGEETVLKDVTVHFKDGSLRKGSVMFNPDFQTVLIIYDDPYQCRTGSFRYRGILKIYRSNE